jgi:hypothetical protein
MKISIKYGALSGIIISAWIVCGLYFKWYETGFASPWNWLSYIIQIIFLYFGMKETKVKEYLGKMSYPSALLSGLTITLTLALIYSLANYLYYYFGNNDVMNFALMQNEKYLTQIHKTEMIAENSKVIVDAFRPGSQAKSAFTEKLVLGVVFTFIFAMIHRKKDEPLVMDVNK